MPYPQLAVAADVLSDQLREHLARMATLLEPHAARIEQKFLKRLEVQGFDLRQRTALASITTGAAARILTKGREPADFIEQVEYSGKRLAKLNLPPSVVLEVLEMYDRQLAPSLKAALPKGDANLDWVRKQLQFCVVLTLNNAYYQVREAETRAFHELFSTQLKSRNMADLWERFLSSLVRTFKANAGRLYLFDEQDGTWTSQASLPKDTALKVQRRGTASTLLAKPLYVNGNGDPHRVVLDAGWKHQYKSCWSIPLLLGGKTSGVLQLGFIKPCEWLPREQELLAAAAERCGLAAEKQRLVEDLELRQQQVHKLAEHTLHVEEIERQRISRELHDEAGQSLLCIRLQWR